MNMDKLQKINKELVTIYSHLAETCEGLIEDTDDVYEKQKYLATLFECYEKINKRKFMTVPQAKKWDKHLRLEWNMLNTDLYESDRKGIQNKLTEYHLHLASQVIETEILKKHDEQVKWYEDYILILEAIKKELDLIVNSAVCNNLQILKDKCYLLEIEAEIEAKKEYIKTFKNRKYVRTVNSN